MKRILFVEDESAFAVAMIDRLESEGYRVEWTRLRISAWERLAGPPAVPTFVRESRVRCRSVVRRRLDQSRIEASISYLQVGGRDMFEVQIVCKECKRPAAWDHSSL